MELVIIHLFKNCSFYVLVSEKKLTIIKQAIWFIILLTHCFGCVMNYSYVVVVFRLNFYLL